VAAAKALSARKAVASFTARPTAAFKVAAKAQRNTVMAR
jgi:hypothetical protein